MSAAARRLILLLLHAVFGPVFRHARFSFLTDSDDKRRGTDRRMSGAAASQIFSTCIWMRGRLSP